jgi:hypothetical protein
VIDKILIQQLQNDGLDEVARLLQSQQKRIEELSIKLQTYQAGIIEKIAKERKRWANEDFNAIEKISVLEKERDVLTKFVNWSLNAAFAGSDICGGDAQDKMFELGILNREIYNPEVHTLSQGNECDAGDYIYFKAPKEQEYGL